MLEEKVEGELEGDDLRRKRKRACKVAGEDIIKQPPAPAVVASASTIETRLDPCVQTSTLSTRPDTLEIRSAVPVISRDAARPIVGISLPSSPPAKFEELSRNTHITSSTSSRVCGGPIRVQSAPSASMTSSMVRQLCDVGLSRIMSSPAPSANIASLPIPLLSSTALPTRKDGKQWFQKDFITESIPVPASQVSPAPRFSSILAAVKREQEEDMVKTGASESLSGSDITETLSFATMAEKDLRIGRASESTHIMEKLRAVQESTQCDKRSQSHSSSVLAALNASSEEPTSTIHTNLKSHTEPNLTPLQSSESAISEVHPFQRLNDKNDLSDKMEISPVSEKMANITLSTSGMEAEIATKQESQLQQAPATTMPVISLLPSKSPTQTQTISMSSNVLAELTRMLTKSKEERQAFLDREFDTTKNLIDKLIVTTCKEQRKRITSLWKEKIRYAPFFIRLTLFGC